MKKILSLLLALLISTNAFAGETEIARLKQVGFNIQQANEIDDIYLSGAGETLISPTISGNLTFSGAGNTYGILGGATSKSIFITGGSSISSSNGYLQAFAGTGGSTPGDVYVGSGTGTTTSAVYIQALGSASTINFQKTGSVDIWEMNQSGQLVQDVTNGGALIVSDKGIFEGITSLPADVSAVTGSTPTLVSAKNSSTDADHVALIGLGTANSANIDLFRTRTSDATADTIVQSADNIGSITFYGADGASYRTGARISVVVDGTPGASDMPARIEFYTTPDGSASTARRWYIDSAGGLRGDSGGTFTSARTTDLGWTVASSANQACNTTCNSACVVGLDSATSLNGFLTCTDANADVCLCAGS